MRDRPYTLLSCCVSIDGYIGSAGSRLLLSNDADFDRVDAVRASCDAILVGAATVRIDNPRLLVRSQARRDERAARGLAGVADEGDGDPAGGARRARRLLHRRRRREDRLLREPAGRGRARASGAGRDRRRRRRQRGDAHAQHRPCRAGRRAADGRGRRRPSTPSSSARTSSTSCSWSSRRCSSATRRRPGSYATVASPGTRAVGRRSSTFASSATWCSCGTPSRRGSRRLSDARWRSDLPPRRSARRSSCPCGSPTATRPTPACSASTGSSTAGSTSRSRSAIARPAARRRAPGRAADPPPQRVPHRRRIRESALRLRAAAARGCRAHRRRRRLPALPAAGGPRHRALLEARGVRAAGHRGRHLRREPRARPRRGRAQLRGRRADAARARRVTGRAPQQQPRQGPAAPTPAA